MRNEVTPGADWVIAGEGVATRKWDGTSCLVRDGKLYKRYDAKVGKAPPADFTPAQEPDAITWHWPGWVPVGNGPEDKWHLDAKQIRLLDGWYEIKFSGTGHLCYLHVVTWHVVPDGTYELCGPKLQGNPERFAEHVLIAHGVDELPDCPRDFDGLKVYLVEHDIEGVVWWRNDFTDCDKVKIKAKDFGIKRGGK